MSETAARVELQRLARFGALLMDAHSCFIFLPGAADNSLLTLAAVQSPSEHIVHSAQLSADSGLIAWVAKHQRPIHVSPFERDSRTLGIYSHDEELKSVIGIPIRMQTRYNEQVQVQTLHCGVLACDSKKALAFSKAQSKLLEELSQEISYILQPSREAPEGVRRNTNWSNFLSKAHKLSSSLGSGSVEVLRIRPNNSAALEMKVGTGRSIEMLEQMYRLVEQSIPPHFGFFVMPTGDMLVVLDNMMTGFVSNKVLAVGDHLSARDPEGANANISFSFIKCSPRYRGQSIEECIQESAVAKEDRSSATESSRPGGTGSGLGTTGFAALGRRSFLESAQAKAGQQTRAETPTAEQAPQKSAGFLTTLRYGNSTYGNSQS